MPPKRKALDVTAEDGSPPLKRKTRSHRPLVEAEPEVPSQVSANRHRTANGDTENFDATALDNQEQRLPPRRGRPASKNTAAAAPSAKPVTSLSPHKTHRCVTSLAEKSVDSVVEAPAAKKRSNGSRQGRPHRKMEDSRTDVEASSSEVEEPVASSSKVQPEEDLVASNARTRTASRSRGKRTAGRSRSKSKPKVSEGVATLDETKLLAAVQKGEEYEEFEEKVERTGSSEPDELLLTPRHSLQPITPPRSVVPRLATPPRSGTARSAVGTPRYIMHSVQITTPSWLRNPSTQGIASPRSNIRGRSSTPFTLPLASKSTLSTIPSTSAAIRPSRTPQPSTKRSPFKIIVEETKVEFDDFPTKVHVEASSPTKRAPGHPSAEGKGKAPVSPGKRSSRILRTLPKHLESCLQIQKHATLVSLQKLPQMTSSEGMDIHPNAVAYEQLTSLLLGTVMRSEGNSCLITGPRGSGKNRVSLICCLRRRLHLNVDDSWWTMS